MITNLPWPRVILVKYFTFDKSYIRKNRLNKIMCKGENSMLRAFTIIK